MSGTSASGPGAHTIKKLTAAKCIFRYSSIVKVRSVAQNEVSFGDPLNLGAFRVRGAVSRRLTSIIF
jgi:hypothetical protein